MSISHAKSLTIADFTGTVTVFNSAGSTQTANATDIVRPSDWNHVHNQFVSLTGNTNNASTLSGSNIILSGGNGVTLVGSNDTLGFSVNTGYRASTDAVGLNSAITGNGVSMTANSSGISLAVPAFLTTAMASNAGSNFVAASATIAGTNITGTVASNGLSLSVGNYITTAMASNRGSDFVAATAGFAGTNASGTIGSAGISVSVGNYITTARASNDAIGTNTALTANGVSVTANSSGLSLNFPAFLTTARGSTDGLGLNTAGSNITWTANSSGVSIDARGYAGTVTGGTNATVTANSNGVSVSVGNYITTARASTDAIGLNSALTANGVSMTANSSGLSLNFPAFLTTARRSTDGIGLGTAGTNVTWTANSNGLSLDAGGYAGTATTFNGANISGSMTVNSAGVNLSLSAAAPGGGGTTNQTGPNIAAGTQTATAGTVVFSNSNGVTFGMSNSSVVTASVADQIISDYEVVPFGNNTSYSSYGQNSLYFMGVHPTINVSMTAMEMIVSLNSATSTANHSVGETISYGWYLKGTGASTSRYESLATSSIAIIAAFSSNTSGAYTISNGANSFTVGSAGTVFGSVLSGQKIFSLPMATSLSAGGDYMFCLANSTASVGATGALRLSYLVRTHATNASYGGMATSGIAVSAASLTWEPIMFVHSVTSGAWPATWAKSDVSINSINQPILYLEA